MITDSHYLVYRKKFGQNLNCVYVASTSKSATSRHALTFMDDTINTYERKKLEALYMKVMNAGEVPALKELKEKVGKLYYAVEEPYGIIELTDVALEGNAITLLEILIITEIA